LDLEAVALRFTFELPELYAELLFDCVRVFLFEATLLFRDGVLLFTEELRLVLPLLEVTAGRCFDTLRFEFTEGRVFVFPRLTVALRLLLRLFVFKELLLFFAGAPRLIPLFDTGRPRSFLITSPLFETAFFLFNVAFLSALLRFLPLLPSTNASLLLLF
jgi:hypothetical protein